MPDFASLLERARAWLRAHPKAATAALTLLTAALGSGIAVTVTQTDPDPTTGKPGSVTVIIGPAEKRTELKLPPAAREVAQEQSHEAAQGRDEAAHAELKTEAGVTAGDRKASAELKPPGQPALPANPPLASANTPGCRTTLVRNFSSRAGAPILLVAFHYTVSTDSGWNGILGNVRWLDSPAAQASYNYVLDRFRGHCALLVPEASKAWAQAAYNPWTISVSVTARGNEPGYVLQGAGFNRAVALMRRFHKVYGIPYRRGAVSGGRVTRTGFVQHSDFGSLGGGHHDIRRTTSSSEWSIARLIDAAKKADAQPVKRPELKPGARGDHVRYLKRRLRARGSCTPCKSTKIDPSSGYYGPPAQAAVRAIKRAHGLPRDAVVGPRTWRLLG